MVRLLGAFPLRLFSCGFSVATFLCDFSLRLFSCGVGAFCAFCPDRRPGCEFFALSYPVFACQDGPFGGIMHHCFNLDMSPRGTECALSDTLSARVLLAEHSDDDECLCSTNNDRIIRRCVGPRRELRVRLLGGSEHRNWSDWLGPFRCHLGLRSPRWISAIRSAIRRRGVHTRTRSIHLQRRLVAAIP